MDSHRNASPELFQKQDAVFVDMRSELYGLSHHLMQKGNLQLHHRIALCVQILSWLGPSWFYKKQRSYSLSFQLTPERNPLERLRL